MMKTNSGLPPPDLPTLEILLTPRPRSTTGSMRTGKDRRKLWIKNFRTKMNDYALFLPAYPSQSTYFNYIIKIGWKVCVT